jgi:hypothetical protein
MWHLGLNVVDMMRIVMVFGHYGGSPIIQKGGVGRERIPLGSHSYALGNAFFLVLLSWEVTLSKVSYWLSNKHLAPLDDDG